MKGRVVVIGELAGRPVAGCFVDGVLEHLALAPPDGVPAPEAVMRGTMGRLVKGMGGAFVDLPGGARGFLRETRGLAPGGPVVVQVAGVAEPGKAVPLTRRLSLKGRGAILTPGAPGLNISRAIRGSGTRERLQVLAGAAMAGAPEDWGLILRSAAELAPEDELAAEIATLRALAADIAAASSGPPDLLHPAPDPAAIARRDWTVPPPDLIADDPDAVDHFGLPEAVEALLSPEVVLPGGARMFIEPTRACVGVDVNTGPDTSPAAAAKANLAAARALPRQLRLRGLGGLVVIDFAPLPRRDRGALDQALRAAFRRDGGEAVLAGFTATGAYEVQRRRDGVPLALALGGAG